MVQDKIKAVLDGEKEAETLVAKARADSEKALKDAKNRAAEIMKEAEAAAEAEAAKLESKSNESQKADLENYRKETGEKLERIDKQADRGFEQSVKLVISQLI
jgi:vacuolar-type H+-ATPase subunit H